jgi:lipopolysaccharide assembly protein A
MKFLKTLFWVTLLVCLVLISWRNWDNYAQLVLFEDPVIWIRIPVLIIGSILIGLIPYFIIHKATRFSLNRKLQKVERQLNDARALSAPVVSPVQPTVTGPVAVPPVAS